MENRLLIILFITLSFIPGNGLSQNLSDYLILEDIGSYKKITKGGRSGNILAGAGHFGLDHKDKSYGIVYVHDETQMWIDVKVTQHEGNDSDKWLLHELDMDFRTYYGIPGISYGPRQIDGQTILEDAVGGRNYRWMSNDKVIVVEYHDSQMAKPEPIEIVKAYLAKHPSTLPPTKLAELRSPAHKTIWIKGEMERRLGLCDKWLFQLGEGKTEILETLEKVVKHMEVFLNYRERYHGIKAKDEKIILMKSLDAKDGTAIKNKLAEYKKWWVANKGKSIKLP